MAPADWIKSDLHIHTLDDPKDALEYSAHELLERARSLDFKVLAITLHDALLDDPAVLAAAESMGILLIPAAEMRLEGADIVLLNVRQEEISELHNFEDVRRLRARRGSAIFTFAPHPFYLLGGSIGGRLVELIDCFDAIEFCHFHLRWMNPNRQAVKVAQRFGRPLLATSDAHRLQAFGQHYTMVKHRGVLTVESFLEALHAGPLRLTSPPSSLTEVIRLCWFLFVLHPLRMRRRHRATVS